jgi:4-amino-4-deoxy-L-arabinose transferase-like glycosyltransferase
MTSRPAGVEGGYRRDALLLTGLALLLFTAGLGLRDPWPADEPLHVLIARDMLASGNWLIPMTGGDLFQDKPPLLFWLQAVFFILTGSVRAGFLLPSLLAGIGTLLLVHDLGRRLWSREAGMAAALVLLFTVQFTLQARRAQLDALLVFFTTLSLYCLLRQLLLGGGWRWALGAGVAAGLGVLTKVVGFFSYMVLLPWLYALWRGWPGVRWQRPAAMWLASGLACALVAGSWLLPIWLRARHDPAIADYFHELVVTHTVGRYVTPWHHYKPAWYYLQVIATLWLPLALLLPWLAPKWAGALRARDARVLLPLGFAAVYVLFFTLTSGKRDIYILSALPMLALAAGPWLPQLLQRRGPQRALAALVLLVGFACLGGSVWLGLVDAPRGRALLADSGVASLAPLVALGVVAIALLAWARLPRAPLALAGTLASGWLIAGWWVFPQMDGDRSARDFIQRVEAAADPARELGLLAYHEHFLLHLTRPTVNFGHRRFREGDREALDAAAWLAAGQGRQLLVSERMLAPCFLAIGSVRDVGESSRGRWYVVEGQPDPGCAARGDASRAIHYDPRHPPRPW